MGKRWKTIKHDTDTLIEIAYKAKYNNIKCPPKDEIWSNIKKELVKKQKRSIKRRNLVASVIILIFTGFFFVSGPTYVGAFANKIIKSIINITDNTFNISKKVSLEADDIGKEFDDPRLAETQSIINFELAVPRYMPKDYYLEKINVLNNNKQQEVVSLYYTVDKEDEEKEFIQIDQESDPHSTSISLNLLREPNTEMKEIKVHGTEYVLILYKNEFCKLMWDKGNVSYTIHGKISEDEMLKIAQSMK